MGDVKFLILLALLVGVESSKNFENKSLCDMKAQKMSWQPETELLQNVRKRIGKALIENEFLRTFLSVNSSELCAQGVKNLLGSSERFEFWALKSEEIN